MSTSIYAFDSKDSSDLKDDGKLMNSTLFAKGTNFSISVQYFSMNDWYHPYGNPIYENTQKTNRMMTYGFVYEKEFSEVIKICGQTKVYYNIEDERTDFEISAVCTFDLALTKNWIISK
ncbi:MAG: hypothetical protein JNL74_14695 [Fibrobacteres bacterium]|nr:hypothetical protein [Fibrobacterota bacterium]